MTPVIWVMLNLAMMVAPFVCGLAALDIIIAGKGEIVQCFPGRNEKKNGLPGGSPFFWQDIRLIGQDAAAPGETLIIIAAAEIADDDLSGGGTGVDEIAVSDIDAGMVALVAVVQVGVEED